jgi:hypothetical protein
MAKMRDGITLADVRDRVAKVVGRGPGLHVTDGV